MTTEKKQKFPLSLSAIRSNSSEFAKDKSPSFAARSLGKVVMPQTATQNAANKHVSALVESDRSNPLVSDAVRRAMVQRLEKQGVKDPIVLAAMMAVPRHAFVDSGLASQAYIDASLPIGHHQTISQPYIVARMMAVLRNGGVLNRVLEIGTGCGYQAAVLSQIAREVHSIERIHALHELAANNLQTLARINSQTVSFANLSLYYGDGMMGLPHCAPFDGIILAAAGLEVPSELLQQMAIGGRLIAPVGAREQVLQLIERVGPSDWQHSTLEHCHFVPLRSGIV